MTLIITVVAPWGVWQANDHRLTHGASGRSIPGEHPKHVHLDCPDGQALLAYTGTAWIRGTDLCDWIGQAIRGEQLPLIATLNLIRKELSHEVAFRNGRLLLAVGALAHDAPYGVVITNLDLATSKPWLAPTTPEFRLVHRKVVEDRYLVMVPTNLWTISREDRRRLNRAAQHRPRVKRHFHDLLAAIIKRASANSNTISASSTTTFLSTDGEGSETITHGTTDGRAVLGAFVFRGIDLTEDQRLRVKRSVLAGKGSPMNPREYSVRHANAMLKATSPKGVEIRRIVDVPPPQAKVLIPAQDINVGNVVVGPFPVPAGHNAVTIQLDATASREPISVCIDVSDDGGETWRFHSGAETVAPKNADERKLGFTTSVGAAYDALRLIVTDKRAMVRLRLKTSVGFRSKGGTIVLD